MLANGRLMVGGRDAKGNDAIVKKHLKGDDMYFTPTSTAPRHAPCSPNVASWPMNGRRPTCPKACPRSG